MKISLKIFVFTYCVMMCIMVIGGFTLVNYLYHTDMNQAMDAAQEANETLYIYVASLKDIPDNYMEYSMTGFIRRMSGADEKEPSVFIGDHDAWLEKIVLPMYSDLQDRQAVTSVIDEGDSTYIQVTCRYRDTYIINYRDVTGIFAQRDANFRLYRYVIIVGSMVIAIVLYIFSWYITRPITRITRMAEQISEGNYSVRVDADYKQMKTYEVTKLGETLNELARNTEAHIGELEDLARRREEFMGNFTHEIKTPLTSIIGYADLLRTYDLEPEKRREYSNFIYNEGKRLEQLSLNLLHLIVLGRTDFPLSAVEVSVFFDMLQEMVRFSREKYHVTINMKYEEADVLAETTLLSTAILNLVDNACKASEAGQEIWIIGAKQNKQYSVSVVDEGYGIPASELDKIKEPFYMVDKSRARKQGGAGLGLALCYKIAEIHSGRVQIESEPDKGTTARILVQLK